MPKTNNNASSLGAVVHPAAAAFGRSYNIAGDSALPSSGALPDTEIAYQLIG